MLVDSHCHLDLLDLKKYEGDLDRAVQAARDNEVTHLLTVSTAMETFPQLLEYAKKYDDVTCSVGVHPNEQEGEDPTLGRLIEAGSEPEVVAIGETGLDYYRSEGDLTWQHERFRRHIQAAKALKKGLIVHTRDAREDTLKIMREENAKEARGVLHCFTETWEMAKAALDMDFYISFSGIVTFKNALELKEVAKKVPLDRILVETDSPFLAPVPYRGKPNEPAYVKHVAEYLAELRGISFEEVAELTTKNFFALFPLSI